MLLYLHKKRGGLFAIDVTEITRVEDITEEMEREARKAMEGRNQTARVMGWDEQTECTTAGGSLINGYHDVTESAEDIRAMLAETPTDGVVKVHSVGGDGFLSDDDGERVARAFQELCSGVEARIGGFFGEIKRPAISVLTPEASDKIAESVTNLVAEWKRAGSLLATTIHDVGSLLKSEIAKPLQEHWAAGGRGPLREALAAWTEAAKRVASR